MQVTISKLTEDDLQRVDDLSRRARNTLGFLTTETFRDYLKRGRVLGARTSSGELIAYLLFADCPDRFRISQLCVSDQFRGQGIARLLVRALTDSATTQKVVKLRCRRDFPAHGMWAKLGFLPLDEKPGRSAQGHPLTLWCLRIAQDDELGLWKAEAADEVLDVVIDAQIFYDFDATETANSIISKGLLNDFLLDSLNLWITEELFLEIDRQIQPDVRTRSMARARGMARLPHKRSLAEHYTRALQSILPYQTPSEKSDIHHLANTAASDVKIFATKDERLLQNSEQIKTLAGITVIHPSSLITSLHELSEKHSYSPARVSGMALHWRRLRGTECPTLPLQHFQKHGETRGRLLESIRSFISYPTRYRCELLQTEDGPVAIRVLDFSEAGKITVPLARVLRSADLPLYGSFLAADILSVSVEERRNLIEVPTDELSPELGSSLINMGFRLEGAIWIKITLPYVSNRNTALEFISQCRPGGRSLEYLGDADLEKECAPLVLDENLPIFLIPIKPAFAMGMIDRRRSAEDLFGGNPSTLLRWDNVYYRKNSRHKMMEAPGRILWYVSHPHSEVIATSHLDEIDIDNPKCLFRKYQKFGILEWKDLHTMSGHNIDQKIMSIRFSRTFLFNQQIPLAQMREIFCIHGVSESLQSPSKIRFEVYKDIYEFGFKSKA